LVLSHWIILTSLGRPAFIWSKIATDHNVTNLATRVTEQHIGHGLWLWIRAQIAGEKYDDGGLFDRAGGGLHRQSTA